VIVPFRTIEEALEAAQRRGGKIVNADLERAELY
jgi:hypothetical protein